VEKGRIETKRSKRAGPSDPKYEAGKKGEEEGGFSSRVKYEGKEGKA